MEDKNLQINRSTTMDDEFREFKAVTNERTKELEIVAPKSVPTIDDRDNIPLELRREGITCYVQNQEMTYQLKGGTENIHWGEGVSGGVGGPGGSGNVHIGDKEPVSVDYLWVDPTDEDFDGLFNNSEATDDLKATLKAMNIKIEKAMYAIEKEIDSGYFKNAYPGFDGDEPLPEGAPVIKFGGPSGTVKSQRLRRGFKNDIEPLKEGELGFCIDTEELYIGNKGLLRLLAKVGGISGGSGGGGTSTTEYVELISPNKKKYRLTVNDDGLLQIYDIKADEIDDAQIGDSGRFKGLLVYKVYGAGNLAGVGSVPVSHSFIELYNNSNSSMNLKGLSIQYAEYQGEWQTLSLKGIVQPFSSFLIRCREHVSPTVQSLRCAIKNFDMQWDMNITEHGKKIYLCVGHEPCKHVNPFDIDGIKTKAPGYIDMLSAGGKSETRMIDGYETSYLHMVDRYTAIYRTDFNDTDDNSADCEPLDFRYGDMDIYYPRCSADGQWDVYFDKMKLDPLIPNLINMGFGQDGDKSRTFTWQSVKTKKGALRYKLKGSLDWIIIESNKVIIQHYDIDAVSHSVIVRNLAEGTYRYQVGEEGRWSDEAEFIIRYVDDAETIKFLNITDQQGWNEYEYRAWEIANAYIEKNEEYDFILNTGDMTQNANRSYEWRYYYEMARRNLQSHPHMMSCGNNDLVDKKDPIAFTYYATYENSPQSSVYSFNYGFIHFITLNTNIIDGYTDLPSQIEWIKEDMDKPENKKRWTIVLMHENIYNIVRNKRMERMHNVLVELGVDLVLGGHHHCYTRSNKMTYIDADNKDVVAKEGEPGVVYVMGQATGIKLSGKTKPTENANFRAYYTKPGDPCYIMWEATKNEIRMYPYRITNVLPYEANIGKDPYKIGFDEGFVLRKN